MSDSAYGWTYTGLNIASGVGQIAGRFYGLRYSRTTRLYSDGSLEGYRYYDLNGQPLYDVDMYHHWAPYKHYHGWSGPGLSGRTVGDHMSYFDLIWWLLGGNR